MADLTDASRLISEAIGGFVAEGADLGTIVLEGCPVGFKGLPILTSKGIGRSGDKEHIIGDIKRSDEGENNFYPFVCGYGAGRYGIGPDPGRSYRIADSVATLFRYQETLIDPELTLRRLESLLGTDIYSRTIRGLKRALGLSQEDSIELRPSGGIVLSGPTVRGHVPLEGWADGYRLTFSWILDLYAWALRAGSLDEEGHIEGILLVDEIEQHLHPSMQAEILPRLSELLPKMQIFVTTHSPLVALDARPEELVVLRRDGDHVVAEEHVPDFSSYSAEDMLSDPRLFDTEVYGSEAQDKISEYKDLSAIPQEVRSPEQREKLRSLAVSISSFEGPAERENETSRLLKELTAKYGL